jgi:hypothetical protein
MSGGGKGDPEIRSANGGIVDHHLRLASIAIAGFGLGWTKDRLRPGTLEMTLISV